MRIAFGSGLCRFGMFRAVKSDAIAHSTENTQTKANSTAQSGERRLLEHWQ